MKKMTAQKVEGTYGTPASEWDQLEEDAMEGRFVGEPRGEVITGRPLLFDEHEIFRTWSRSLWGQAPAMGQR